VDILASPPVSQRTALNALGFGAALGAYVGVTLLRRLSPLALRRAVFALLLSLGLVMISEAAVSVNPVGVFGNTLLLKIISGLILGVLIGAISGVLGVTGGEIIIPP
jgi:uncharacterized membrane protein YfcA